jgi:hypothetical protein
MGSAAMHAVLFGVAVYLVSMYGPGYGVSYEGFQDPAADWAAAKERYLPSARMVKETQQELYKAERGLNSLKKKLGNATATRDAERPAYIEAKAAAEAAGLIKPKVAGTNLLTSVLSSASADETDL